MICREVQTAVRRQRYIKVVGRATALIINGHQNIAGDVVIGATNIAEIDVGYDQVRIVYIFGGATQRVIRTIALADQVVPVSLDIDGHLTVGGINTEIRSYCMVNGKDLGITTREDARIRESLGPLVNLIASATGVVIEGKSHRDITGQGIATAIVDQGHSSRNQGLAIVQAGNAQVLGAYFDVGDGNGVGPQNGVVALTAFTDVIVYVQRNSEAIIAVGTAYGPIGDRERSGGSRIDR